jgi:hypothetical protein
MRTAPKSTSLKELGYTLHSASGKDENGNEWVYRVKGPTPEFFIKKTKRGRLVAYKTKDAKIESTIEGLYNFKEQNEDLVGQRAPSQAKAPALVKSA